MVATCYLTFPSLLTGTKLETTGNAAQISTLNAKITHAVIGNTTLVIKYFLGKKVSTANQKVGMKVILGLSHQFIQFGQPQFTAEQNWNARTFGESHLFQRSDLTIIKIIFYVSSPSPTHKTLTLTDTSNRSYSS